MPKFFGPDTVLWYYPTKPALGIVFYTLRLWLWPLRLGPLSSPLKIVTAIRGGFVDGEEQRDLLLLLLIAACFVPYVTAPFRSWVFFGWLLFFCSAQWPTSKRCFASSNWPFVWEESGSSLRQLSRARR